MRRGSPYSLHFDIIATKSRSVTMSSLPSVNETIGGNNTINENDHSSSSMILFNHQPSSSGSPRFGNEHRNGNETENENEDSRKGLAWMPRQFDDDKKRRAKKKEQEKQRMKDGTVNHWSVSQSFSLLLLLICLSSFLH